MPRQLAGNAAKTAYEQQGPLQIWPTTRSLLRKPQHAAMPVPLRRLRPRIWSLPTASRGRAHAQPTQIAAFALVRAAGYEAVVR
jgi:hypothetical protein